MWWPFNKSSNTTDEGTFQHSVASFDPLPDSVIIWTRVSPPHVTSPQNGKNTPHEIEVEVGWQVSKDAGFSKIIQAGTCLTSGHRDYTVTVDVKNLEPYTNYFYRFTYGTLISPTGRTKTMPSGRVDEMIIGLVSCANYGFGYFNVYDCLSRVDNLDVVVHAGDYIYEYEKYSYPERLQNKRHGLRPKHHCQNLKDYRERYATYRTDKGLQKVHASVPFICIWDDHEISDSAFITGSEDDNGTKEEFQKKKYQAIQAFIEYNPIRGMSHSHLDPVGAHRIFEFGDLATLMLIESRLSNRSKPLEISDTKFYSETAKKNKKDWNDVAIMEGKKDLLDELADPNRKMIGDQQVENIAHAVRESVSAKKPWQILTSQTVLSQIKAPKLWETLCLQPYILQRVCSGALNMAQNEKVAGKEAAELAKMYEALGKYGCIMNPDAWDGFEAERERLIAALSVQGSNPVILAGDSHNAWVHEVLARDGKRVAVEFDGPAVTSIGFAEDIYSKFEKTIGRLLRLWPVYLFTPWIADALLAANPDTLKYCNLDSRGFVLLHLTHRRCHAEYHYVSTVSHTKYKNYCEAAFYTEAGEPGRLYRAVRYLTVDGKIPHRRMRRRRAIVQSVHDVSRGMQA